MPPATRKPSCCSAEHPKSVWPSVSATCATARPGSSLPTCRTHPGVKRPSHNCKPPEPSRSSTSTSTPWTPTSHPAVIESAWADGDVDVAIVAFGILGDAEELWQNQAKAVLIRPDQLHRSRFGGGAGRPEDARPGLRADHRHELGGRRAGAPVELRLRLHQSRPRRLLPRSRRSVAGVRCSRSGHPSGPGADHHHRTWKATGAKEAPFTVDKEYVAELAVTSAAAGKELVWAPGSVRGSDVVLRHIPRPIFRKLPI